MFKSLRYKPFFVLLLSLFFMLHGLVEHYGVIDMTDIGILTVTYLAFTGGFYLLSWLFFRNALKASILTSAIMASNFFFGAVFDFLKLHSPVRFFYKYNFLLGIIVLSLIVLFIVLKKAKRPFYRLALFLNMLLLIYIIIDLGILIKCVANPPANKLAIYDFTKNNQYKIADSCSKPDIYLLLFDEYASSRALKQRMGLDNDIDSFLKANQFLVQEASKSNYEYTVFSMASMLNMCYHTHIKYVNGFGHDEVLECYRMIKENQVISYLSNNGYEIENLSIFDLAGAPSHFDQTWLPLKTKMITEGTLVSRIIIDFGWWLNTHKLLKWTYWDQFNNNQKLLQEVRTVSTVKQKQPRFIYAHFLMPHSPYFVDRYGNKKADTTVFRESEVRKTGAYADYLLYVNTEIKKMVPALLRNTDSNALIIVMGDHGFRKDSLTTPRLFQNLNAVYFPPKYHSQLYDSITNINQFPAIFNTLFHQNFPLQKDSCVYLLKKTTILDNE